MDDRSHMRAAIGLARRGLGVVWPNPSVGCVIVRDGRVVGRGVTAPGGRPHAEPVALAAAGAAARGATAYVTLEPCCHQGVTPPCTEALIAAGIARVVMATRDPDIRVNGAGVARLRQAGIVVEEGLLADEAREIAAGFFRRVATARPLVTLKLASTLDGRIATGTGESRWITGAPARQAAHALRGRHDAVLVGAGTVRADDPDLTCRIEGFRTLPVVRVIADTHLTTAPSARVAATAHAIPTWICHGAAADRGRGEVLEAAGVRLLAVAEASGGVDLGAVLLALAEHGITRVLAEGGARLAAGLLRADLVDRLAWFHAPALMGGDGLPAAAPFGVENLRAMPRFVRSAARTVGDDMLTEFRRAA